VPIGRGQSLVVCGERGTGKTTTALDVLVSQKTTGVAGVYVALGKTEEEVTLQFHFFNISLPSFLTPVSPLCLSNLFSAWHLRNVSLP
jgi:KaiC/GvpD/RAD55 family RecA-like ATPase